MNFTEFDVMLIVTMSIAVVSLAFTMPALGMTEAATTESDIPEFDISSDRFDFVGDFPDRLGGPAHHFHHSNIDIDKTDRRILFDSGNGHINTFVQVANDNSSAWVMAEVNHPDMNLTTVKLEEVGQQDRISRSLSGGDIDVEFELTELEYSNLNNTDAVARGTTEIIIHEQPDSSGWISELPVVGTAIDAGGNLAGFVGWIGSVIWWMSMTLFEVVFNLIGMLYDAMHYVISTLSWLTGTYGDIISSANSWASVFVAIPGMLLFLELFKLTMIAISLLPTT